jgi:hypothetical protein
MAWSKEQKQAYQRKYWSQNKDRINAAKRIRYYTDAEFREREIARKMTGYIPHPVERRRDKSGRFMKVTA